MPAPHEPTAAASLPAPYDTGMLVQVRLGSTRLPGKALLEAGGVPLLGHLIRRARCLAELGRYPLIVATTARDAEIADFCARLGIDCLMGEEEDVTLRLLDAAHKYGLARFVRLQGDDPLVCPYGILAALAAHDPASADVTTTAHLSGWPVGTASMVMETQALAAAYEDLAARDPERLRRAFLPLDQGRLRIRPVHRVRPWDVTGAFFTIDHPEDFALFRDIVDHLRPMERGYDFPLDDVYAAMAAGAVRPGNRHRHEPFPAMTERGS
ncbi:cytidylyltransferase domain-containing protein [Desulfolutivibrio sulfoxidireducens]|uniref:cytidylyltransferase domain-containing protein n=1 Tax=Desulfolutivibrio sulfoxidireducens TaxID=2773299 RepID=UPI00159E315D|nr:hypothetical protein [Desulfolutivibrio sulfoxidireducens]QLA20624.1 hypothetical protein GD604_13340 [Desulfolutivibrio sulfoxidireducens]